MSSFSITHMICSFKFHFECLESILAFLQYDLTLLCKFHSFFFNDTKVIQFKHVFIPYIIFKNQKSLASQWPLWECHLKVLNDIPLELSSSTINAKMLKSLSILLLEC